MEVIFMGTGTSTGVPVVGYDFQKHECDLENPKNWRTRTSVHVVMDGVHVQVDAAPEFRLQCLWNEIREVDLFILTHGHADHIAGMDDLRRFCPKSGALACYSSEEGRERICQMFPYAVREKPKFEGYPAFELHDMPRELELPCGKVYSTMLPHGGFEVLGLVFEEKSSGKRFAYYTDCHAVSAEGKGLAESVDLLAVDGLRYHEHPSHMSVEQAVSVGQEVGAKNTYLTHMGHHVDYERGEAELPKGVGVAYDGMRVSL